uniref:C-type lectin domain-containing protein n=1 Tax=Ciona savignyi TaxID=51511 RepID=H2YQG9_CIOSA
MLCEVDNRNKNPGGCFLQLWKRTAKLENNINKLQLWANSSGCIEGNDFIHGNYCYRILRFEVDFWEAELFCMIRGGHLAFNEDENSWNATLYYLWGVGFKMKEIWTGVYKDEGIWKYTDGRNAKYTNWATGNVFDYGDDCAQIRLEFNYQRSAMYDRRCTRNPRAFLCKYRL